MRNGRMVSVLVAVVTVWVHGILPGRRGTPDGIAHAADLDTTAPSASSGRQHPQLREVAHDPPARRAAQVAVAPAAVSVGSYTSVQINVDAAGNNVIGDAANEPSLAISATDPKRIVVGWRQFASVVSDFREAGYAYSHDAGQQWTFPGVLEPGVFRSDPVLGADADGRLYYYSLVDPNTTDGDLSDLRVSLFKSADGGVTWSGPVDSYGWDKQWMGIDRTSGIGRGHIYGKWTPSSGTPWPNLDFTRSVDGGAAFEPPLAVPPPVMIWGTLDVGPDGTVYAVGKNASGVGGEQVFARSSNAKDAGQVPAFDLVSPVSLDGTTEVGPAVNPIGLLGQVWVATDHSGGPTHGNVYMLGSVKRGSGDPGDVMFVRSEDGGQTWSSPLRVNDDTSGNGAYQWFGTMSVAPNGRIDAIWNDTRNDAGNVVSEVFYTFSLDAGQTWATNLAVSPQFDPRLGYPGTAQPNRKIGDYSHMVSDGGGANLAYAATFNGEQDVYFLRIPADCDGNGIEDDCDLACGAAGQRCDVAGCGNGSDVNANDILDACEFQVVPIDIAPFSYPNAINTKKKGIVPVAICNGGSVNNFVDIVNPASPSGFANATTNVDVNTPRFAFDASGVPLGATTSGPTHDLSRQAVLGTHLTKFVDTSGDGVPDTLVPLDAPNCPGPPAGPDLVVHFSQQNSGLAPVDTEACVTAALTNGVRIIGCDSVKVPQ